MQKQRARVLWLKEGDKNYKFFHAWATNRNRQNRLITLQDGLGHWLRDDQLNSHIINYFQDMFSKSSELQPVDFLSPMIGRIT